MNSHPLENFDNNDWKSALITSLYSTIEFLKKEIHQKNLLINKLLKITNYPLEASKIDTEGIAEILKKDDNVNVDRAQQNISQLISIHSDEWNAIRRKYQNKKAESSENIAEIDVNVKERVKIFEDTISSYVGGKSISICDNANDFEDDISNKVNVKSTPNRDNNKSVSFSGEKDEDLKDFDSTKIVSYSGAKSEDSKDYSQRPNYATPENTSRKKPDVLIIHIGSTVNHIDTISSPQVIVHRSRRKARGDRMVVSSLMIMPRENVSVGEKINNFISVFNPFVTIIF